MRDSRESKFKMPKKNDKTKGSEEKIDKVLVGLSVDDKIRFLLTIVDKSRSEVEKLNKKLKKCKKDKDTLAQMKI